MIIIMVDLTFCYGIEIFILLFIGGMYFIGTGELRKRPSGARSSRWGPLTSPRCVRGRVTPIQREFIFWP